MVMITVIVIMKTMVSVHDTNKGDHNNDNDENNEHRIDAHIPSNRS